MFYDDRISRDNTQNNLAPELLKGIMGGHRPIMEIKWRRLSSPMRFDSSEQQTCKVNAGTIVRK